MRKSFIVVLVALLACLLFAGCDATTSVSTSPKPAATLSPLVNTGGYAPTPTVAATTTPTPAPGFTVELTCKQTSLSNGGGFSFWGIPSSSVKPNAYGRDGYCILDLSVSMRKSGGAVNFDNLATVGIEYRRPNGSQVIVLVDDYMDQVTLAPTPDITATRVVAVLPEGDSVDPTPPTALLRSLAGNATLVSTYVVDGVTMFPSLEAAANS